MLGRSIGGFVAILIGVSILPTISKEVNIAANNITGASATLLKLVPLFFALTILGIGVFVAFGALKSSEVIDSHDYKEYKPIDTYKPKKKILTTPHTEYKQVYTDEGGKFD